MLTVTPEDYLAAFFQAVQEVLLVATQTFPLFDRHFVVGFMQLSQRLFQFLNFRRQLLLPFPIKIESMPR